MKMKMKMKALVILMLAGVSQAAEIHVAKNSEDGGNDPS